MYHHKAAQILPWPIIWSCRLFNWIIPTLLFLTALCHQHGDRACSQCLHPKDQGRWPLSRKPGGFSRLSGSVNSWPHQPGVNLPRDAISSLILSLALLQPYHLAYPTHVSKLSSKPVTSLSSFPWPPPLHQSGLLCPQSEQPPWSSRWSLGLYSFLLSILPSKTSMIFEIDIQLEHHLAAKEQTS